MKGWFLTHGKFANAMQRLLDHIPPMEHTLEIIDCADIVFGLDNGLPSRLWYKGEMVTPPDFFYMVDTDGENGVVFPLARQLEKLGAFNYNSIEGKKAAMSKIETYQILAREGLPIVKTVVFHKHVNQAALVVEIGLPMIIKPDDGFGGEGIELLHTEEELAECLARLENSDARWLAQEFVATSKGKDVRVLTIGYEAVFAACRQAQDPNEFRSNLHMGGKADEYPLTEEMKELCGKVARAVDLRMAGIDLLFGPNGFVVGEVNSSAGFDSWLGKKDLISIFIKDLTEQMKKRPLAHWKQVEFRKKIEHTQMSQALLELDDYDFVKTERALYADCQGTQEALLMEMVRANQDTEFGRAYDFTNIHSVEDYRARVPISDWPDYAEAAARMQKGEADILFPGKAGFFYRTSGTTASYKFIPESLRESISRQAISRARITEIVLHCGQKVSHRVFAFFNKTSLDVTEGGIPCGTASGRSSQLADPAMVKRLTYPPQLVNEFEGEELLYMMLRLSLVYDDVTAILGNNAMMMKKVIEFGQAHAEELIADIRQGGCRYAMSEELAAMLADQLAAKPERADELEAMLGETVPAGQSAATALASRDSSRFLPKNYWPNMMAAGFWLGGSVGVHVKAVRPLLADSTRLYDVGYGASETKINVPILPGTPAGALATFCNFYEFIPVEGGAPLMAHELEDGKDYELILTTNAGLYRYQLKDIVHVDGFTGNTPNIYFLSKLTDVANLAQEKIPGVMLSEAITDTLKSTGLNCRLAQVYPDPASMSYKVCVELEGDADPSGLVPVLDQGLCDRLIQYQTYRNKLLNETGLVLMKAGWADHMLQKYTKGNATAAQVKVPVVISEMPEKEWQI